MSAKTHLLEPEINCRVRNIAILERNTGKIKAGPHLHGRRVERNLASHAQHAVIHSCLAVGANACGRPFRNALHVQHSPPVLGRAGRKSDVHLGRGARGKCDLHAGTRGGAALRHCGTVLGVRCCKV